MLIKYMEFAVAIETATKLKRKNISGETVTWSRI